MNRTDSPYPYIWAFHGDLGTARRQAGIDGKSYTDTAWLTAVRTYEGTHRNKILSLTLLEEI